MGGVDDDPPFRTSFDTATLLTGHRRSIPQPVTILHTSECRSAALVEDQDHRLTLELGRPMSGPDLDTVSGPRVL